MNKNLLKRLGYFDVYYSLPALDMNYNNDKDFVKLLKFIGEHTDCKNKKRKKIRVALSKITEIANVEIKGVSKEQIKTISKCHKKGLLFWKNYINIPYRVEFIFSAIISLVKKIKEDKDIDLPLSSGLSYGDTFYKCCIDTYRTIYTNGGIEECNNPLLVECRKSLFDSFYAENSPLNIVVGNEEEYRC
jgi:hypothetical protein